MVRPAFDAIVERREYLPTINATAAPTSLQYPFAGILQDNSGTSIPCSGIAPRRPAPRAAAPVRVPRKVWRTGIPTLPPVERPPSAIMNDALRSEPTDNSRR